MRNSFLACALVLGAMAGCSSSYTPGEYATIAYRAPAPTNAAAVAPARKKYVRAAVAKRPPAPVPSTAPTEATRPGTPPAGAGPG